MAFSKQHRIGEARKGKDGREHVDTNGTNWTD